MTTRSLIFLALIAGMGSATYAVAGNFGADGSNAVAKADLPKFECDSSSCYFVDRTTTTMTQPARPAIPTVTAPSDPKVVGPPPGQRFSWSEDSCQVFSPTNTSTNPFVFLETKDIPVPLGSTHASLETHTTGFLQGGPSGVASIFSTMEIRRAAIGAVPAGPWKVASQGVVFTREGTPDLTSRYGASALASLEDLSALPGTGVGNIPSLINVKLASTTAAGTGFTNAAGSPQMCVSRLQVTF